ncbi:N-acetylmuramoyl-L-alanine amidase [Limibacterium fermenti]|uniref:N-acetylmuramoyl-L-alanine amidase n=1 Tax=Limibacterium fermenti TaxID=3229863 RepID=UPI003A6AF045
MRKIDMIIVHCTATREGGYFNTADVDRWHRERGFKEIGYHYLIGLGGEIWKGRDEEIPGAHTKGYNSHSIGVCYVGGLDTKNRPRDTRTVAQKASLLKLLKELKKRYPAATIHGHKEFAAKDCPCFDAKEEYKDL